MLRGQPHLTYTGPIVRINPYELHISDPDYYDTIYAGPTKHRDKWAWSYGLFGNTSSHFASIDHAHHRLRRAPLAPFFSKRSVLKLEPLIKASIEKLCGRLNDFRRTQEPVNLRYALNAMNLDIITDYAFGKSFNCLEQDDFARVWADIVDSGEFPADVCRSKTALEASGSRSTRLPCARPQPSSLPT